jgi:hypothetical protein
MYFDQIYPLLLFLISLSSFWNNLKGFYYPVFTDAYEVFQPFSHTPPSPSSFTLPSSSISHPHFILVSCFWFWFCITRELNSVPPASVHYHLSHTLSPFCFGYFWDRILHYAWAGLDHVPPIYASHIVGMISTHHCAQLLLVAMRSPKLFAQVGVKPWSSQSPPPK